MAELNSTNKLLNELSDRIGKRHSELLDKLKTLAETNPEFAQTLGNELNRSLKSERILRNITIIVTIFILVFSSLYITNPFNIFKDDTIDLIQDLSEREDKPNYDAIMDSLSGKISVVYQNNSLGYLNKLGRDEDLKLTAEKTAKYLWNVGIKNSDDIGQIRFNYSQGNLFDRTLDQGPYNLNEKIDYPGLDLACKINKIQDLVEGDSTRAVYEVVFGEQDVNGNVENWYFPSKVTKSDNGKIRSDPIILWNPDWKAIYIVSIGIGKATELDPNLVYKINSVVHAFKYK